jgi:hypothetical protein
MSPLGHAIYSLVENGIRSFVMVADIMKDR